MGISQLEGRDEMILVTGGSSSGKSEFAENLAMQIGSQLYYIATMNVSDAESEERVRRHRRQREGKGFQTLERAVALEGLQFEQEGATVLLEDLSNLLANEMYLPDGRLKVQACNIGNVSAEQPGGEAWITEQPGSEGCSAEQPGGEACSAKQPGGEGCSAEQPGGEACSAEQPGSEMDDMKSRLEEVILHPIFRLAEKTSHLIIVTNEIFSDGIEYDAETTRYIQLLGILNHELARKADGVVEVVCGIPVWNKH